MIGTSSTDDVFRSRHHGEERAVMTVVVTGVSSFVGMHLAQAFAASGYDVVATHSAPRPGYTGIKAQRLGRIEGRVQLRPLDLRDGDAIERLVGELSPTLWVHHAGYAENYGSPDYDLTAAAAVNLAPLAPLYRSLAGTGCGVIVTGSSMEYASSDAANGEEDACWPETPYGLSKLTQTLAARQYALRFQVPTRVARLYIPFGALDSPQKLLPTVADALRQGRAVDLSPCEQRRDFVAVEDVARGYLDLAADLPRGGFDIFNLCSGQALPLRSLLLAMAHAAGRPASLLRFGAIAMRAGEPPISYGDNRKAARLLNWAPGAPEQMITRLVTQAAA
jgi:nucleoside-diphosphate-sugar epimerase